METACCTKTACKAAIELHKLLILSKVATLQTYNSIFDSYRAVYSVVRTLSTELRPPLAVLTTIQIKLWKLIAYSYQASVDLRLYLAFDLELADSIQSSFDSVHHLSDPDFCSAVDVGWSSSSLKMFHNGKLNSFLCIPRRLAVVFQT